MQHYSPLLFVLLVVARNLSAETFQVQDESGEPIKRFEAMYHTSNDGYSLWEAGRDGKCQLHLHFREATPVDVLVRADGYATAVKRFSSEELKQLDDALSITLNKGRKVFVRLELPKGEKLPDGFVPETYFSQFAERVRVMWQPDNHRGDRQPFNLLSIQPSEDGFALNIADDSVPFYVAIDHPGWLRFCEFGPFTGKDVTNGVLRLPLPRPASIEVRLDVDRIDAGELPFNDQSCVIMWKNPDGPSGSWFTVTGFDEKMKDRVHSVADIGPGKYLVQVRTTPKESVENLEGSEINPGRFFDQRGLILADGEQAVAEFEYKLFDPESSRGGGKAQITLLRADGTPAAGEPAKVEWFDGHYGSIKVHEGAVPDDGVLHLDGVSTKATAGTTLGSYTVTLGEERIGFFGLKETDKLQEFEFRIAPKAGDVAPDFSCVDLATGKQHHLADFRGKIVLVEFWATWCGPCQPAMAKLVEHYRSHAHDWGEDIVVLALSTDESTKLAKRHVESRGWDLMPQYWAARSDGSRLSDAELTYVVHGIPHALLIDSEGNVAWRGHPLADGDALDLIGRVEALRAK